MLNLKDIALNSKSAVVEFPGFPGFKVNIEYISRQTAKRILAESEKSTLKNGILVGTTRDEEKFSQLFARAAITGWEGFTIDMLSQLMLIDSSNLKADEEVPYSEDNAAMLLSNSPAFSSFVDGAVYDIETFRTQ